MNIPLHFKWLLADDDANDTFLLERAFSRLDWARPLATLSDGEQVIDYLLGHGEYADRTAWALPEVILLDHWMPRMSGSDVLNWVRSEPRFSHLPVVLLSGGICPKQVAALSESA